MFRLAVVLGCSVAELGTRISSEEFTEWMAFDLIEPFGSYADDYRTALICRTLAGGSLGDFLLTWGQPKQETGPTGYQLLQKARIITEVFKALKQRNG